MRCTVELFGIARLRAARRAVEVRLGERCGDRGGCGAASAATVADALTALAAACPVLVGPVLTLGWSLALHRLPAQPQRPRVH